MHVYLCVWVSVVQSDVGGICARILSAFDCNDIQLDVEVCVCEGRGSEFSTLL